MNKQFRPGSVGVLLTHDELRDLIEITDVSISKSENDETRLGELKRIKGKLLEAGKFYA